MSAKEKRKGKRKEPEPKKSAGAPEAKDKSAVEKEVVFALLTKRRTSSLPSNSNDGNRERAMNYIIPYSETSATTAGNDQPRQSNHSEDDMAELKFALDHSEEDMAELEFALDHSLLETRVTNNEPPDWLEHVRSALLQCTPLFPPPSPNKCSSICTFICCLGSDRLSSAYETTRLGCESSGSNLTSAQLARAPSFLSTARELAGRFVSGDIGIRKTAHRLLNGFSQQQAHGLLVQQWQHEGMGTTK
eukprot:g80922.t1